MGAMVKVRSILYNAVVQLVLLYGSEIWVVMGAILKVIVGFHHRLARNIMGLTAQSMAGGGWYWPPVTEALDTARLCTIKENEQQSQDTVAAQLSRWTIYDCLLGQRGCW